MLFARRSAAYLQWLCLSLKRTSNKQYLTKRRWSLNFGEDRAPLHEHKAGVIVICQATVVNKFHKDCTRASVDIGKVVNYALPAGAYTLHVYQRAITT